MAYPGEDTTLAAEVSKDEARLGSPPPKVDDTSTDGGVRRGQKSVAREQYVAFVATDHHEVVQDVRLRFLVLLSDADKARRTLGGRCPLERGLKVRLKVAPPEVLGGFGITHPEPDQGVVVPRVSSRDDAANHVLGLLERPETYLLQATAEELEHLKRRTTIP
jgi:hypothetical protein